MKPYISHQATLEFVLNHLEKMVKLMKATGKHKVCANRTKWGYKCPVGAMIPNKRWHNHYSAMLWSGHNVGTAAMLLQAEIASQGHDVELARRCQWVHDTYAPAQWLDEYHKVAEVFGCDFCYVDYPLLNEARKPCSTCTP